ncbi:cytochrome P450 [Streptomyces sp. 3MP-14]|uniref:Cytochrome P450 n=1 Tax=Streptomyces mimosae TaxID=2586635 RepID=A0A5N6A3K0_9ACTN|nr:MULTISPECIES: cytochrome P450 [Streptomyces]KAB8163025.1 cytochrome P450 [Streptomyces mimosae]KAB8179240.1 cytochrome P450 [Streptomyces sp. 3MP-14]
MPEAQEQRHCPFPTNHGFTLHPAYTELRRQPPTRVRLPHGDDAWLATRHADVQTVLSDPRFSIAAGTDRDQPRMRDEARVTGGLFSLDPPQHTRLRSIVGRHFSARSMEPIRSRVRDVANERLDAILEAGQPADLLRQFAIPVPTTIICEILGAPPEDHDNFWMWADTIFANDIPGQTVRQRVEDFFHHLAGMFQERREHPRDDMLTTLVRACDEEGRITENEMFALTADILNAGFVTTSHQIANFLATLLCHPEQLELLRNKPEFVPQAVEELLRYVPILSGFSFARYATEDVELDGVAIRAGEPVIVVLGAANRDPAVFSQPDTLMLDRPAAPHLAFGHGPHYCIGAHLARVELQEAITAVLDRLPSLKLAVPETDLEWKHGSMINGITGLPVIW